jgi:hypothetical protein
MVTLATGNGVEQGDVTMRGGALADERRISQVASTVICEMSIVAIASSAKPISEFRTTPQHA